MFSMQDPSCGMRMRISRAKVKFHRLPQEHFQAQTVAFGPKLKIRADVIWDGDRHLSHAALLHSFEPVFGRALYSFFLLRSSGGMPVPPVHSG
jgi:hypothetical protein